MPNIVSIRYTSVYQNVHVAMSDAERLIRVPPWLSESFRRYFDDTLAANIPRNATNPLFTLPAELLVHILRYLTAADIASIQTVCRTLRDVVKKSAALQFIVESFLAGVVAGPAVSSLATSRARLDRLTDWKRARRGGHWEKVWECTFTTHEFRKRRRIHGQTISTTGADHYTLHFTTFPSLLAGTSSKTWSVKLPWSIRDHWFDSSQEVLVIRSRDSQGFSFLVFHHQSDGKLFPGIETPIFFLRRNPDEMGVPLTVDVKILRNLSLIHLHFESLRQDVIIRDWRTHKTFVTIYSDTLNHFPDAVAFLDADHLVGYTLASGSLPASIIVIPWRKLPGGDIPFTSALNYSTVFRLPELVPGYKYSPGSFVNPVNEFFCEHNATQHEHASADRPFFDAGSHPPLVMLNFRITLEDDHTNNAFEMMRLVQHTTDLRLVIPGRTLTSRVAALDAIVGDSKRTRTVPWRDWGEDTRVWGILQAYEAYVYGSRMYCIEGGGYWKPTKAAIYDFDSVESMVRDICSGDKARLGEIVVAPTHLSSLDRRNLREPVVTKAPYRRLEIDVDMSGYLGTSSSIFGENFFGLLQKAEKRIAAYSI